MTQSQATLYTLLNAWFACVECGCQEFRGGRSTVADDLLFWKCVQCGAGHQLFRTRPKFLVRKRVYRIGPQG